MAPNLFGYGVEGTIRIGTFGWSYKAWKGLFYPQKLPSARWLRYYADTFSATETVAKWTEGVTDHFISCLKKSRFLTHLKKLRAPEEPMERFFSVFEGMKKKMVPVLVQLPAMLRFQNFIVENFYRLCQLRYSAYEFVLEVRHPTWLQEESLTLMTKYAIGFVISQSADVFPYAEWIMAKNVYLRFHGTGNYTPLLKAMKCWHCMQRKCGNGLRRVARYGFISTTILMVMPRRIPAVYRPW
jgi:uncharacterized protein YecE (DUF72 family)